MRQILSSLSATHWLLIAAVVLAILLVLSASVREAALTAMRYLAQPLLLVAVIALVYDGTRTLAGGGGIITTSTLEHWQALAPASLAGAKAAIAPKAPFLWDWIVRLLALPAWLLIGAVAVALSYAGRKQRKVDVCAN